MQLRRIQVKGFKSFADRIVLDCDDGLTCIVGPNGCGKSNLVDAIRWVMGLQSPRTLRASRMQDVLFAGASGKARAEQALVSLTFVDGGPAGSCTQITRTLSRQGDSSYRINDRAVRLKDVQSFFLQSGMGKDALAIFEQGNVEEIIHRSPVQRRAVFEEAASIAHFRERRRDALRKMEQTQIHLARLTDLLKDRKKQYDKLKMQAERADHRSKLEGELLQLEKGLLLNRYGQAKGEQERLSQRLLKLSAKHSSLVKRRDLASLKLQRIQAEREETGRALKARSESLFEQRKAKELKALQAESERRRLKELQERMEGLTRERERVQERHKSETQSVFQAEEQLERLEKEIQKSKGLWDEAGRKLAKAQRNAEALQKRSRSCFEKRAALMQGQMELSAKLQEAHIRAEEADRRLVKLKEDRAAISDHVDNLGKLVSAEERNLLTLREKADAKRESLREIESVVASLKKAIDKKSMRQTDLAKGLALARARHASLARLKEEMAGSSKGTKGLLQAARDPRSPIYGLVQPLCEVVSFDEETAQVAAAAVRPYSQTLLAKTDADCQRVLEYAKENAYLDFSITTERLLQLAKQRASTFLQALRCKQAFSVEALSACDLDTIASDGSFLDHRGVLFSKAGLESNAFAREAERKRLLAQVAKEEREEESLKEAVSALEKEHADKRNEQMSIDREQRRLEMRCVEANFALQGQVSELSEKKARLGSMEADRLRLSEELAALKTGAKELKSQRQGAERRLAKQDAETGALAQEEGEVSSLVKRCAGLERELERSYHQLLSEKRRMQDVRAASRQRQADAIQADRRLQEERSLLEQQESELKGQIEQLAKRAPEGETSLEQMQEECAQLERRERQGRLLEKSCEEEIEGLASQGETLSAEERACEVALAEQRAAMDALDRGALERFDTPIRELESASIALEGAEARVKSLRKELEALGMIHMGAVEEYASTREEVESLETQVSDLSETKQALSTLIRRLDRLSRKAFRETFERVRKAFSEQFQILFEGGEADLVLTDAPDILEAGVEIVARPPGKQLRRISLLSGGEKCLTAMALLFALFEERPAPFAILDEMDAPLDDANIGRFLKAIEGFKAKTQFLVITHNKITMQAASRLFGVTMEKKGVSKVIPLELELSVASAVAVMA